MTHERQVLVHEDTVTLAASVAGRLISRLNDVLAAGDTASIVLTGGSMGSAVLSAVRDSPLRDSVDWSRVHFWWGDERWLPRGDAERNETQARTALLDHLDLAESQVHSCAASDDGIELDAAAAMYAAELAAHAAPGRTLPRFDVTFLGVGPDGHIASLFPDHPGIRETEASVIPVRNSPKPPPERVSLTLKTLNSSEEVWLVLAGADKASALGLSLAGASRIEVPAAGVHGTRATIFFVDAEASAGVPESLTTTEVFWTAADGTELH